MPFDIANALSAGYTNWGQTAGQNIVRNRLMAREQEQQNALAQALAGGDQGAIAAALAPLSPTAAVSYQQGNRELDAKNLEAKRSRFMDASAGTLASIWQLPPDQRPAAFEQAQLGLHAQFPDFVDNTPDPWDENGVRQHALTLAAQDKRYADVLGRVGLLPPEPSAENAKQAMSVQEYQFYQNLPSDDARREFLLVKRANNPLDLGGYYASRDPLGVNAPTPIAAKTLAPGDLPAVRAAQAGASTAASEAAKTQADQNAKGPAYASYGQAADAMRQQLANTMTGGPLGLKGRAGAALDYQQQRLFESRKQQLSTEMRAIFRIPGEGTLSDKEQAQYGFQLPDVRNSPEVNEQIMRDLDARIEARKAGGAVPAPASPAAPAQLPPGWTIKKVK